MHYVYKFLDSQQNVLYIGITGNLTGRIKNQHFTKNGHLPQECYVETDMVVYSKCASSDDAKIKERYLINTLAPKYNDKLKNGNTFAFVIEDFDWKYIGFDNERAHTCQTASNTFNDKAKCKRRIKTDRQSLRDKVGSEVQYDLSSAVRPSPVPGTLWLDAVAVKNIGFDWYQNGDEVFQSSLHLTIDEHRLSFSSSLLNDDKAEPIGWLIALACEESRLPDTKRSPVFHLRDSATEKWIVVAAEFDLSDVRVRVYTEKEQIAISLQSKLDVFNDVILTPDGWTVVGTGEYDGIFSNCNRPVFSKEYWDICESLGDGPGVSFYENGEFQYGHHAELDGYNGEFANYQRQLKAPGVQVYNSVELNEYIKKHKKVIRQLVSS